MESRTVIIREAKVTDAESLQSHCQPMAAVEDVRAAIAKAIADGNEQVYLVAEVDGVAVGQALLVRHQHGLERHRASLYGIVVGNRWQRQGIARALVAEAVRRAPDMGIEILETGARGGEVAEDVYRRLGFIEWGRLPRGIKELWGEQKVYDYVYFYMPTASQNLPGSSPPRCSA